MLAFVLLPALLAVSSAAPGGYTGYGGLYPNMNQNADYMAHAKSAAKLATQIAFEDDESLSGAQVGRQHDQKNITTGGNHATSCVRLCGSKDSTHF